jgi:hypothetical protein
MPGARGALRLLDAHLLALAAALALAVLLAAQLPFHYRITIGQADGPGADLPLIQGFNTPETDSYGPFRWTAGASRVVLAGLGGRALDVTIHSHPISAVMAERGPRDWTLLADGRVLATIPVRPQGGSVRVCVPPGPGDDHVLELRSATTMPPGDTRELGVLVDGISVRAIPGLAAPPWRALLAALLGLALAWATLRQIGFRAVGAAWVAGPCCALVACAAFLDMPRFALGGEPALVALGLAWALGCALTLPVRALLGLAAALLIAGLAAQAAMRWWGACLLLAALDLALAAAIRPAIARRWHTLAGAPTPPTLRVLALLTVSVFALRYGGKIYPEAMPGDIGFHVNRFGDALRGTVFLLSKNRGVDFPYPPALYILLAPLALVTPDRAVLLQISAALMDAAGPALIYVIARRSTLIRDERFALLAAGLYALSGAGFMPTWWNFSTHIFAQFTHLLLVAALVVLWPRLAWARHIAWLALAVLAMLQLLVYLGHFGFWLNMGLVTAAGAALLPLAWTRDRVVGRRLLVLLASAAAAHALALLLFYSAYAGLFAAQAQSAAAGGLTGVAGRAPVPPAILWQTLCDGLYAHIGLLPIPLALCAVAATWGRRHGARADAARPALWLMLITFAIGAAFAALPFLTGSTLSTRWLMFSIWALSIGAAAGAEQLWRRGIAGRVLTVLVVAYPAWLSAAMWLMALAWRVRPPEPF